MSKFYLRYFKTANPFKTISNLFRNYKKSCENFFRKDKIKRNQSEPVVLQNRMENEGYPKPKSQVDIPGSSNSLCCSMHDWNNAKFDDNSSQESLKVTWSNVQFERSSSNIALAKKNSQLDINIQEKLNQMPVIDFERDPEDDCEKFSMKRAYPWQNFNIADDRMPNYEKIRTVENLTSDVMHFRKSILRKPKPKSTVLKEVKFKKIASMMIYPKNSYVIKESRINMCTNVGGGDKTGACRKRKVKDGLGSDFIENKIKRMGCGRHPAHYRKNVRSKMRKYTPVEHSSFWYFNKKQNIF